MLRILAAIITALLAILMTAILILALGILIYVRWAEKNHLEKLSRDELEDLIKGFIGKR